MDEMTSNDLLDDSSVVVDLEPCVALLLSKALHAGLNALAADLTAEERETLAAFAMFLDHAAGDSMTRRSRAKTRKAA
jgi:hypothetical protein